jgi:hypothetical protein
MSCLLIWISCQYSAGGENESPTMVCLVIIY